MIAMRYVTTLFFILLYFYSSAQNPSEYGAVHPDAVPEASDWEPLIGSCTCKSVQRNNDGSWQDTTELTWIWKYIMEGKAVQDITIKKDGNHTSSIRQFNADSSLWYVTFFSASSAVASPPTWEGEKVDDDIILYKPQTAPNGMEGYYKITFSEISNDGFNWIGEWVDPKETFSYPTWKIYCRKTEDSD
jgi:hypothetical protein